MKTLEILQREFGEGKRTVGEIQRDLLDYLIEREAQLDPALDGMEQAVNRACEVEAARGLQAIESLTTALGRLPSRRDLAAFAAMGTGVVQSEHMKGLGGTVAENVAEAARIYADGLIAALDAPQEPQRARWPDPISDPELGNKIATVIRCATSETGVGQPVNFYLDPILKIIGDWLAGQGEG